MTRQPGPRHRDVWLCLLLFALSTLAIFVLQPRIGVISSDSQMYVLGAYSLQAGEGYRDLNGMILNHWPPGYSWMLSRFGSPIAGSRLINYPAFGALIAALFLLARTRGWTRAAALGLSLGIGFGFWRILAITSTPDVLCYALFLLGTLAYTRDDSRGRLLGYAIWSSLILLKLIAVAFVPGAILGEWLSGGRSALARHWRRHAAALVLWAGAIGAVVAFDYVTNDEGLLSMHVGTSMAALASEARRFGYSVVRSFLAGWSGSIRPPEVLVPFGVTLGLAIACVGTLRRSFGSWEFAAIGVGVLACSWGLGCIRLVSGELRLMGYGVVLLLLSLRPGAAWDRLWLLWGAAAVGLASWNTALTGSLGVNDPRYERLARAVAEVRVPGCALFTNSLHILDIHERIPSRHVESLTGIEEGGCFLEVTLPNYGVEGVVSPIERPQKGWQKIAGVEGADLYRKTASEPPGRPAAFHADERLTFTLRWSGIQAGTATTEVSDDSTPDGMPVHRVVATIASGPVASLWYRLHARLETSIDAGGMFPRYFETRLERGEGAEVSRVVFDALAGNATIVNDREPAEPFPVPAAVQDPLSALFYLRTRSLQPGAQMTVSVLRGRGALPVQVLVRGTDVLDTPWGRVRTLKVGASLGTTGGAAGARNVWLWLTDDARKLPVRIESEARFGTVVATLAEIRGANAPTIAH